MKINTCQFTDTFFPIMDGVSLATHNYAAWLNLKFGKSMVVAPKMKDFKDRNEYKVLRFKSNLMPGMHPYKVGLPYVDFKFKKKVNKQPFDLFHTHSPFVSGHLALNYARKMDLPIISTFHTPFRDDLKKTISTERLFDFMMQIIVDFYHSMDQVWVPNRISGKILKEYGYKGEYEIVPEGTDFEVPDKAKYRKLRNRGLEEIGVDNNQFVLVYVGQQRWENNLKLLLESCKILKEQGEQFIIVFVGVGYAEKEMRRMVKSFGLNDHVEFFGLVSDRLKMSQLYACADLNLAPAMHDNKSTILREAATFNLPSIVVKDSLSSLDVVDNINGFVVDDNPVKMSELIVELKGKPEIIRRVGEGARKTMHRSWQAMIDEVAQKYEDIIQSHYNKQESKVLES